MNQRPRKVLESPLDISSAPNRVRPDCIFNCFYKKNVSMTIVWSTFLLKMPEPELILMGSLLLTKQRYQGDETQI